ncbi:hypothetical protein HanPI659440_Chr13g0501151 [Helianthus annuus]|nr:hypothetical protein HanPI659440_Chr13g0501151 [Helianthus annuus]
MTSDSPVRYVGIAAWLVEITQSSGQIRGSIHLERTKETNCNIPKIRLNHRNMMLHSYVNLDHTMYVQTYGHSFALLAVESRKKYSKLLMD